MKEIIYAASIQDRIRQWGLLFVTVVPPGSLEVVKALPGSFERFLTCLDLSCSECAAMCWS